MMSKSLTKVEKLAYTLQELSSSTGLSVNFYRLEIERGHLRRTLLGRRVVVLKSEVERYLAVRAAR
jgi:hypothetical protein